MKIKMLTSMAGADVSLVYGEIVDQPDAIADAWVEAGIAAPLSPVPPVDTAPAAQPILEAVAPQAPEVATTRRKRK